MIGRYEDDATMTLPCPEVASEDTLLLSHVTALLLLPTAALTLIELDLLRTRPAAASLPVAAVPSLTTLLALAVALAALYHGLVFRRARAAAEANARERQEASAPSSNPTLREFLSHPEGFHMAFAPAFFGFFAYFGALAALEEETGGGLVVPTSRRSAADTGGLRSAAGASAGAMAAVMLAAGIQPNAAADFASGFTWSRIADPPGWGGYVKGYNFEAAMRLFLSEAKARLRGTTESSGTEDNATSTGRGARQSRDASFRLEEALVPVAVSVFDLLRMKQVILSEGCMGKAARASAGFPLLFQPVPWRRREDEETGEPKRGNVGGKADSGNIERKTWWRRWWEYSLFIDGGITDWWGLNGLAALSSAGAEQKRVINMTVGDPDLYRSGLHAAKEAHASHLISIALVNTPTCGPHAMDNGPRATEATRRAMASLLDVPMERVPLRKSPPFTSNGDEGDEVDASVRRLQHHYVLRVDASKWLD